MEPKISIIIPVYNTEKYLRQCIDSVVSQTYPNKEIVLVDDGSLDSSPKICDEYADNYEYINVIHKKNGGLSDARNAGIKKAGGDYIMFLDSDDYWDNKEGLAHLVKVILRERPDVLSFHYRYYFEDTNSYKNAFMGVSQQEFENIYDCSDQFNYLISKEQYIASACNKIIDRKLFDNNELEFVKDVLSEDVEWCARLALRASSFGISNEDMYVYRQRKSSITHTLTMKNLNDLKDSIVKCAGYANGLDSAFKEAYLNYVAYQYAVFFVSCGYVKDKEKKEIINRLRPYAYLLNYNASPKVKKMSMIYKMFGYGGLQAVGNLYSKIRKD